MYIGEFLKMLWSSTLEILRFLYKFFSIATYHMLIFIYEQSILTNTLYEYFTAKLRNVIRELFSITIVNSYENMKLNLHENFIPCAIVSMHRYCITCDYYKIIISIWIILALNVLNSDTKTISFSMSMNIKKYNYNTSVDCWCRKFLLDRPSRKDSVCENNISPF